MTLARDLLAQARLLAEKEPKNPRQASLRRAVSAAYYALFHLLAAAGAKFAPAQPPNLRGRVQRAFNHKDMQVVCRQFQSGGLNDVLSALIVPPLQVEFQIVGDAFVELQNARHRADYDVVTPFTRQDVLQKIRIVELAFTAWDTVKDTPNGAVFLTALLLNRQWKES